MLRKFFCFVLCGALSVFASEPDPPKFSVFLLQGGGICATAFLIDAHHLVTNQHVSTGLCAAGRCRNIDIRAAVAPGKAEGLAVRSDLREVFSSEILDLAILRWEMPPPDLTPLNFGPRPVPGDSVRVLGYPNCGRGHKVLEESFGRVLESNPAWLRTDAKSWHGGSGGPVLDARSRVVAVTSRVGDMSLHMLIARSFDTAANSRSSRFDVLGVATDVIADLRNGDDDRRLTAELRVLNRQYSDAVEPRRGWAHLRASIFYSLSAASAIAAIATRPHCASLRDFGVWIGLRDSLSSVPMPDARACGMELTAESLQATSAMLIENGIIRKPLELRHLRDAVEASRLPAHIKAATLEPLARAERADYGGLLSGILAIGGTALTGVIALAGFVTGLSYGRGRPRRRWLRVPFALFAGAVTLIGSTWVILSLAF